jgi:hypothetical protein
VVCWGRGVAGEGGYFAEFVEACEDVFWAEADADGGVEGELRDFVVLHELWACDWLCNGAEEISGLGVERGEGLQKDAHVLCHNERPLEVIRLHLERSAVDGNLFASQRKPHDSTSITLQIVVVFPRHDSKSI